ncbi:MAG TPA: cell division protein SepF [Syntrophomonadaceae bacterium]|nr:cell division protein SepF [Syntrophomonadaceae bacterium]HNX29160.1 cell division protein SepF [Syntrophomonadaceae bacterium]HPR93667.1 cell division protein SepF [Syntrophomonadaceae bacterium]
MSLIDKFWAWFGVDNNESGNEVLEISENNEGSSRGVPNVVSIHTNKNMKVVVCEPDSFDEAQALADHLKSRRQVILNLENTPPDACQRIVDFISGTTYALEGNSQQLGKTIFIFTPSNVEISKDHRLMRKSNLFNTYGGGK